MKKTITTAVALAAALALAAPAPAAPGTKAKLKISTLSAAGADGTLSSKKAKCERGRKVTLRFVGEYGDVKIGSDRTDKTGRWAIDKQIDDRGIFYATTPAKTSGKTTCAAATSKDKRL